MLTTREQIWRRVESLTDSLLDSLDPKCAELQYNGNGSSIALREAVLDIKKFRNHWCNLIINENQAPRSPEIDDELLARLSDVCSSAQAISSGVDKSISFIAASHRLVSLCWRHELANWVAEDPPGKAKECPALKHWIYRHQEVPEPSPDDYPFDRKQEERKQRWAEIGEEVLERKTLWLTAAAELQAKRIPGIDYYKVSATDVFVEKAQKAITDRAVEYQKLGKAIATGTVGLMCGVCWWLYVTMADLLKPQSFDYTPFQFVVIVIRLLTIGTLMGGIGYFLIGIARAFLHEGTALYSRRHALRFGRLYVYLKGGEIKDVDELEKAFKWNDSVHTAFSDIRADKASRSIAHLVSDLAAEALKLGRSAKEQAQEKKEVVK